MMPCNLRSLLVAVFILSNCITWTSARRHFTHNTLGHRSRHRRQATGIDLAPDCSHYKAECDSLSCSVRTVIEPTGDGCKSCRCFSPKLDCKAELKECEALTCPDDIETIDADNGCERCKCKVYDPCAGIICLKDEWCEPHTDYGVCMPAEAAKTTGITSTRAIETTTTTIKTTETQPKTESLTEHVLVVNSTTEAAMTSGITSTRAFVTTITTNSPTKTQPKTESLTEPVLVVNSITEATMTSGITSTRAVRPTETHSKTKSLTEPVLVVNSTTAAALTLGVTSTRAVETATMTNSPTKTQPKTESLTEPVMVVNSTTEAAMISGITSTRTVETTTTTIRPTETHRKTESLTESVLVVNSTTKAPMTSGITSTRAVQTTTMKIKPTETQRKTESLTEPVMVVNSTTEATMTSGITTTRAVETTTTTKRPTEIQPKTESLTESGLVGSSTTEATTTVRTALIIINTTSATIMPTETQSKPGSQTESGQSQSPSRPQLSPEPELNSNRTVHTPDCSRREAECTRLNCEFGTLHLRHADGCERCHCFSPEIDCKKEKEDCSTMRCMYGMETNKRANGSKRCVCKRYPCDPSLITCQEGKRCVVATNLDREYITECRDVINPGECSVNVVSPEQICFPDGDECDDDADCTGVKKCCRRGCVKSCIEPVAVTSAPTTLPTIATVTMPYSTNVTWPEGDKATLRCLYPGKTSSRITWRRGDLPIDVNVGRYRLTSAGALEIVSLYHNDSGMYSCAVSEGHESDTQQYNLVVKDPEEIPVGIAGDDNAATIGELDRSLVIRCLSHGYPVPYVFWLRNNTIVLVNDEVYEIRRNSLLIKSLAFETLGQYTCQAFNGHGKAAAWKVLVRAYRPDGFFLAHEYLVERQNVGATRNIQPSTTLDYTATTSMTTERSILSTEETSVIKVHTVTETEDSTGGDMLSVITQPNENTNFSEGITLSKDTAYSAVVTSITTESLLLEGCAIFKFGCCYDNHTEALGPDRHGCPCSTTEFGCCPDGATPAQDKDNEGCQGACKNSSHGCCEDNRTPAHGPHYEGCCLLTAFGCCPDNRKAAEGPHLESCGCQFTQHGCCPDNVTSAQGPKNEGCGCQYTEFGCCPDRHTKSSGPDFASCSCQSYQFGCCPDGVTIATSPEQRNCRCQSTFGCCSDKQTAVTGPNGAGCDCASSEYGCCPDGQTEAQGSNFLGCVDVPENKQAVCYLPADAGPCRNFEPLIMWYYDLIYDRCSRFWYRGCGGNGNRFISREDCEDVCIQPGPKKACKLPHVKGSCESDIERWYFNTTSEQCLPFRYGGCLGNANNFDTRELCQTQCEPDKITEICNLPIEQGHCAGNYSRWGYNSDSQNCEQFAWSGCEGNSNRFISEYACKTRCSGHSVVCAEQQEAGNCSEKEALWSFSQTENRCVPFYYTGCGGNRNRYDSKETCEQFCPSVYVPDKCTQPAVRGDCSKYLVKWYFDTRLQRCRRFHYGGCGGNLNNFDSEIECLNACSESIYTTTVRPTQPQHQTKPQPLPGREYICQLPMTSGPCRASLMRWFYDPISDSCSQFTYGGCQGNDNRFESREACESRCRTEATFESVTQRLAVTIKATKFSTTSEDYDYTEQIPRQCKISSVLEECQSVGTVWYYDPRERSCVSHVNKERGRNCRHIGTFGSEEACARGCGLFIAIVTISNRTNVTWPEGDKATLQCLYPGKASPKITWRRGDLIIDVNVGRYRLTSAGALEIVSLYRNDSGVYSCVVGDGRDSDTQQFYLVVKEPEYSTVGIAGDENTVIAGELGSPLMIRCLAYGYPVPGVFWTRHNSMVPFNNEVYEIIGHTLIIRRLANKSLGQYICKAYNGYEKLALWVVEVRAYGPDGSFIENENLEEHQNILTIKDTQPPNTLETISTTSTTNTTTTSTTAAGHKLSTMTVSNSMNLTWPEGDKATLRCLYPGKTSPRIIWRRGDLTIDVSVGRYRQSSAGVLEIVSLYRNDSGVYSCVVGDGQHSDTQQFNLVVKDPESTPVEIAGDDGAVITGELGKPLEIRCLAYGYPVPGIFWTQNNKMVPYNDKFYEIRENTLLIRSLAIETLGQYTCQAYNGVGKAASWVVLVYDNSFLEHGNLDERKSIPTSKDNQLSTILETTTTTSTTRTTTTSTTTERPTLFTEVTLSDKCIDNPFFANCDLIVRSKFCDHKYYSHFCCKSCVLAGLLDPQVAEAQAVNPFRS